MADIRHIGELQPDKRNARKHNPRNIGMIVDALHEVGPGRSIVIDEDNNILAGNGTWEAAAQAGIEKVQIIERDPEAITAVRVRGLSKRAKKRLALFDNRTAELAEWEPEVLAEDKDALDGMFTSQELDDLLASIGAGEDGQEPSTEQARLTLAERFGVPPFSVLDARQGYWQERKRAWITLGIQSELGRGGNLQGLSESNDLYRYSKDEYLARIGRGPLAGKKNTAAKACPGGSLDAATRLQDGHTVRGDGAGRSIDNRSIKDHAWQATHLRKVQSHVAFSPEGNVSAQSGTSIFDPVLCELAYRWFSPPDGFVLDPFAGGSVRGIVAATLGRNYAGIDLRPEQVEANREQAGRITPDNPPAWIVGDSRDVQELAPGQYDLLFSCPPYADLEVYSDDPRDLSTLDYEDFKRDYRHIIAACVSLLKPDRFAVWVVGDVRDKKGYYRNFVSDTIAAFQDAGARLYNDAILVTSAGSLPIRAGKQFDAGRKLGKTHQNVLVFVKGDARKATEACGHIEVFIPEGLEGAEDV